MNFMLIGVNHKTAPVEVRERLSIPESRLAEATRHLIQLPGVEEGLVLSTCNRVELLAGSQNGSTDLRQFFSEYFDLDVGKFQQFLYEYRERDVFRHLFRVASSLDSMIVGEPQILGQVKEAYTVARAVGGMHSQLDALVTRSFAVAKRVRAETAVGSSAVSVASVAVDLARKIFGDLQGKQVFLVGAGKMSELAARHLMSHGASAIIVANRTHQRALQLAEKFGGEAIHFEQLYDTVDRADIVITSTGAPHAIFRREHGEMFLSRRKNRPMFFIDIAVPRDVDPEMNKVDGIFVYDIDDLQSVLASNVTHRQQEASRAESIIESEVQKFSERQNALEVVPTIISLQERVELIREAEIDRVKGRLGKLSADQEAAIDSMTRGIVNKILHSPLTTLKTAASQPEATSIVELMRRIFNLSDEPTREREGRTSDPSEDNLRDKSKRARPRD